MKNRFFDGLIVLAVILSIGIILNTGGGQPAFADDSSYSIGQPEKTDKRVSGLSGSSYKDLKSSHWAYSYIDSLSSMGMITGYPNGTFKPEGVITRAEFTKMITLAADISASTSDLSSFNDVSSNHWAKKYVEAAKERDIITGYSDGTFRPNSLVARSEAAKMVIKAGEFNILKTGTPLNDIGKSWAYDYIMTAKNLGIISGYPNGSFGPNKNVTRAEASKIIVKLLTEVQTNSITDKNNPYSPIPQEPTSPANTNTGLLDESSNVNDNGSKIPREIAFARGGDIWTMNADGSNQRQMLDIEDNYEVDFLTWAKQGDKLAFGLFSNSSGNDGSTGSVDALGIVNADGSGYRKFYIPIAGKPSWSPDGTRIAITVIDLDPAGVYVVDIVNNSVTFVEVADQPQWSPDGRYLAFCSFSFEDDLFGLGGLGVYNFQTDQTTFYPTENGIDLPLDMYSLAWLQSGQQIIFEDALGIIYSANLESGDLKPLSTGIGVYLSPSGSQIATTNYNEESGSCGIKLIDLNGGTETMINYPEPFREIYIILGGYSSDGKSVVFCTYAITDDDNESLSIWVADLSDQRLTKIATNALSPAWRP